MSYAMYPVLRNIEFFGYEYINKIIGETKNISWVHILKHVKRVLECKVPEDFCQLVSEYIFYNKNICMNNQTVYFKSYVDNNINRIYHLTKTDGSFLTFDEFQMKYVNVRTNFVTYNGLIMAIKAFMRK